MFIVKDEAGKVVALCTMKSDAEAYRNTTIDGEYTIECTCNCEKKTKLNQINA